MGVDTIKLSYPLGDGSRFYKVFSGGINQAGKRVVEFGEFTSKLHEAGTNGPVWYRRFSHPGLRAGIVFKGVPGASVTALYEGSVPKELGVCGAAPADCVDLLDTYIRGLFRDSGMRYMPRPALRRIDLTHDQYDPSGRYRAAALNWNPHARSRYVQARYQADETVWQHNQTRGVRVYDKYAEELSANAKNPRAAEWARDLTRIEYQIRGAWIEKYGLDLGCDWATKEESILRVLVDDLGSRVAAKEMAVGL